MENKLADIKTPKEIWTPEQIQTIKNTVAIGANDSELDMFLSIAAKYELDPFLREIWFANMGNKNAIMTGRDGYLKIANRNPNFNGMTSDVVCANDKFMKEGDNVRHAYNMQNRGMIVGAYAVVHRKDREHPAYCFAPFREYNKSGRGIWSQYPSAMILKVAESMALKRAFSISGLVTEEEISNGEITQESTRAVDEKVRHRDMLRDVWQRYCKLYGSEKAQAAMTEITGKTNSADYTDEDIQRLYNEIKQRESKAAEQTPDVEIIDNNNPTEQTQQEGE